jgi:Putative GTPases (G3E family)
MTDTLLDVDIVIFEHDIGETDIDVKVLQEGERSLTVYEMTENCVCCTGKADFLNNLMTILSALDPEVLIVEPTGAARLSILVAAIEGLIYNAIDLLTPITIVDATTLFMEQDRFSDLRLEQIRHAYDLILYKSEPMEESETARFTRPP